METGVRLTEAGEGHLEITGVEHVRVEDVTYLQRVYSDVRNFSKLLYVYIMDLTMTNNHTTDNPDYEDPMELFWPRFSWLLGLMIFQSLSSFILSAFQDTIEKHTSVVIFLTMLIGAGGNAGSQSTILVVRKLAVDKNFFVWPVIRRQIILGLALGASLAFSSVLRVYPFDHDFKEVCAIALSLFLIISVSTVVGACTPLVLNLMGFDPGHAGAALQVIMDILGVFLVMITCKLMLR